MSDAPSQSNDPNPARPSTGNPRRPLADPKAGSAAHQASGADPVQRLLDGLRLAGGTPRATKPGSWRCRCPAHDDRNPSLVVSYGKSRDAVLKCHGGCPTDQVLAALGMTRADLFRKQVPVTTLRRRTRRPASHATLTQAAEALGREMDWEMRYEPWPYHRADGSLAFAVVRYDTPGWPAGSKQVRPFHPDKDGWQLGLPEGSRPLYNLAGVTRADCILVVEGERCADRAADIKLVATTSAMGAGSARKTDWSPLAGKHVAIVPDNDAAGERYATDVDAILDQLRPRPLVTFVRLPDLSEGGDLVDWVDDLLLTQAWPLAWCGYEFDRLLSEARERDRRSRDRTDLSVALTATLDAVGKEAAATPKLVQCALWLQGRLAGGPVDSTVIEAEAQALGVGKSTLQAAKRRAGVVSERTPLGRGWRYTLKAA